MDDAPRGAIFGSAPAFVIRKIFIWARLGRMGFEIQGLGALVCGASKGIGRAVAERLLAEGARVVAVARTDRGIPEHSGRRAVFVQADLATAEGCEAAASAAEAALGRVELLFLNAGGPPNGAPLSFDDESWRRAFDLNLLSAVRLCRRLVPSMVEHGFGRIVALTSVSAREAMDGLVLSNAMRPAVHGFLKTLSRDIARHGVTCNAIAPGFTATDRVKELIPDERLPAFLEGLPRKRMVEPAETAALAAFLFSPGAAGINGVVIPCDGGSLRSI